MQQQIRTIMTSLYDKNQAERQVVNEKKKDLIFCIDFFSNR